LLGRPLAGYYGHLLALPVSRGHQMDTKLI
jgi:hypothetical protein